MTAGCAARAQDERRNKAYGYGMARCPPETGDSGHKICRHPKSRTNYKPHVGQSYEGWIQPVHSYQLRGPNGGMENPYGPDGVNRQHQRKKVSKQELPCKGTQYQRANADRQPASCSMQGRLQAEKNRHKTGAVSPRHCDRESPKRNQEKGPIPERREARSACTEAHLDANTQV